MFRTLLLFFLISFSFCAKSQQSRTIRLIIYSDFVNPQETYESLTKKISISQLTDSIKIIGRPIITSSIDIKIDTARAINLELDLAEMQEQIRLIGKLERYDELMRTTIKNSKGQDIPLNTFASFQIVPAYYRPHLFIPKPEQYIYKGKKAVKIEMFYKSGKKKQLVKFIKENMAGFSDCELKTEYELLN